MGESAKGVSNLDNAWTGGLYNFYSTTQNRPPLLAGGGTVFSCAGSQGATQIATDYNGNSAMRVYNGEWEYLNPPMTPGVEYRTTERHNGQPVYVKLIHLSKLGAAYSAVGGVLSSESIQVISLEGVATNGVLYQPFPLIRHDTTGVVIARLYVEWSTTYSCWQYYSRSFDTDMSSYSAYIIAKYIKV